jgi:signal transduction histidine kinase
LLNLGWDPARHPVVLMRKVRTVATMAVILQLVSIPFLVRAIEWQIGLRLVTIPVAMLAALSSLLILCRFQSERVVFWTSQWLCLGVLSLIEGGVLTGGGSSAVSLGTLVVLPLFAGVTAGRRAAMLWGVIALLMTVLVGVLEFAGFEFHNLTPPQYRHSQALLQGVALMVAVLGIISGFFHQLGYSEALLAQQNQELQAQIAQTRRAVEEAQAAERAKTRFLANMSHELRTPLNAIVGFSRRLDKSLQGRLSEREADSLLAIQRSGSAMLQLVEDLFDLSALDSADLKLNRGPVELQQLLEGIRYKLGDPEPFDQDRLKIEAPATLVLHADARRFEQALLTLLRFCVGAGGGSPVLLQAAAIDESSAELQLHVTGKPDLSDWRERLFDRYNHLHSWQDNQGNVSGLGLALASELIRAQHGSVVCAESAQGLTFVISMPRLQR